MRTETSPSGRSGTFIEAARRAQIVDAAIATVNKVGYHRASLARIAAFAGISKSVITYHFDGKEELLLTVVEHVFGQAGVAIEAAVAAERDPAARLAAYIRAELLFMRDERESMLAAMEILISHRDEHDVPLYLKSDDDDTVLLESILTAGMAEGVFRDVDLVVATTTVVHAIDGAITRAQVEPATDLVAYGEHLIPLLLGGLATG